MGKIRDMCIATGQTQQQLFSTIQTAPKKELSTFVKEKTYGLPHPYNRSDAKGKDEKELRSELLRVVRAIPDAFVVYVQSTGVLMRGKGDTAFMGAATHTGFPDLVLAYRGFVLFCELKVPGGRLRGGQLTMLQNMQKAGMNAVIGVNLVTIIETLRRGRVDSNLFVEGIPVL